jgi:hypothetical protein
MADDCGDPRGRRGPCPVHLRSQPIPRAVTP